MVYFLNPVLKSSMYSRLLLSMGVPFPKASVDVKMPLNPLNAQHSVDWGNSVWHFSDRGCFQPLEGILKLGEATHCCPNPQNTLQMWLKHSSGCIQREIGGLSPGGSATVDSQIYDVEPMDNVGPFVQGLVVYMIMDRIHDLSCWTLLLAASIYSTTNPILFFIFRNTLPSFRNTVRQWSTSSRLSIFRQRLKVLLKLWENGKLRRAPWLFCSCI